jgi:hypothetical protein
MLRRDFFPSQKRHWNGLPRDLKAALTLLKRSRLHKESGEWTGRDIKLWLNCPDHAGSSCGKENLEMRTYSCR